MILRLRLITGVILFFYVTTHLIPLVLGNHSLVLAEWARPGLQAAWEGWIGQTALIGSITLHFLLGLYAIYRRRKLLEMTLVEALQLSTGIALPMLLALHVVSTAVADFQYDLDPNYRYLLAIYLKYDTISGWRQAGALAVAWFHGCIGIYFWLRLKPSWPQLQIVLTPLALLWPTLAFTGYWRAGTEAAALTNDPIYAQALLVQVGFMQDQVAPLLAIERLILIGVLGAVSVAFVARFARRYWERRAGFVQIQYDTGEQTSFNKGMSLLEASRDCGYPHASVCGGKGRCSTCRVRVRSGIDLLPPPSEAEKKVLDRIKAGPDVRLACQAIPACGVLEVSALLPASATASQGHAQSDVNQGKELTIAVLFCDLRGFTQVSEDKLPYDTVFLLNRYFDSMGRAIEEAGGHIDKFIGDGIMALFGIDQGPEVGCQQALNAARGMSENLRILNERLVSDLPAPLRVGIGIHVGSVIVGEMGYGRANQLTAIGNAVNIASRLESKTKDYSAQLVASRAVFRTAGVALDSETLRLEETTVRGRTKPIHVVVTEDASSLPAEDTSSKKLGR